MKKLALWVLLAGMVSFAGCDNDKPNSVTFKGPSGETSSITVK